MLRIGLVGSGEVTEHKHLPALRRVTGAKVVAVADPDATRLGRVADRFEIRHRFPNIEAMLQAKVVDVIGVLVPPAQHEAVATAACAADLHILIEKPVVLDLEAADRLRVRTQQTRARVLMGFHMRWHRLIRQARADIRAGRVGTPLSVRSVWCSPRGDVGLPDWRKRRATGGGALVELGVHVVDLWRFLLDAEVTHVSAMGRNGLREDEQVQVVATLSNGVVASVSLSERTSHAIELDIGGDRGRLRVDCQRFDGLEWYGVRETGGMVRARWRRYWHTLRALPTGIAVARRLGDYGDSYRWQWQHLVDCIKMGTDPECQVEDGVVALRVILAAAASLREGGVVEVERGPGRLDGR